MDLALYKMCFIISYYYITIHGIFTELCSFSVAELYRTAVYINKNIPYTVIEYRDRVNCFGVPLTLTYDNGRFELEIQGMQETLFSDVTSPSQPSWFLGFSTSTGVELSFTEPYCINGFNPQFRPKTT